MMSSLWGSVSHMNNCSKKVKFLVLLVLTTIVCILQSKFVLPRFDYFLNGSSLAYFSPKVTRPIVLETKVRSLNYSAASSSKNVLKNENLTINLLQECSICVTTNNNRKVDMSYVKEMKGFKAVPYDESKLKTIFVYNNNYGEIKEGLYRVEDPKELLDVDCPEPNCVVISSKTYKKPIHEHDAIIFHTRSTNVKDLPKKRSPHQRYIFKATEPAAYSPPLNSFKNFYNWTMAYRLDSDIPIPYGLVWRSPSHEQSQAAISQSVVVNKTKTAAWFVSNCGSTSNRKAYVSAMEKYITVDIYGNCGKFKCPRSRTIECYEMIERDYYFYLSFENSLCKDYVTEKLFSLLKYRVIPVVFGSADYKSIAPPKSVISVFDFGSVKVLTDYLKYLMSNSTAYNEYFEWKHSYILPIFPSIRAAYICHICYKLHHDHEVKVYSDINHWFKTQSHCNSWSNKKSLNKRRP